MQSGKWEKIEKAYGFMMERNGQEISLQELVDVTGWSLATIRTHRTKKLFAILRPVSKNLYKIENIEQYTLQEFKNLMSQKALPRDQENTDFTVFDPFSVFNLQRILRREKNNANKIAECEAFHVEYKESFNLGSRSDYAKAISSLANNKGGYIVFGVSDSRDAVGLVSSNFETSDPEKLSNYLRLALSSEPLWRKFSYFESVSGLKFGFIYVYASSNKPVIAKINDHPLLEGEIYYRYIASSRKIGYSELSAMLDELKRKSQETMFSFLNAIQHAGLENSAILNTLTGEVEGAKGRFFIDRESIDKIKFIKMGEFSDVVGAPTLRLVGDVFPIDEKASRHIVDPTLIDDDIILRIFLSGESFAEVESILKYYSCNARAQYLPLFYFLATSGLALREAKVLVENETPRNPRLKNSLLLRLQQRYMTRVELSEDSKTPLQQKRIQFKDLIKSKELPADFDVEDLKSFFEAILQMNDTEFDKDYLRNSLLEVFEKYYQTLGSHERGLFRKSVCYLDELAYRHKCLLD